MRTKTTAVRAVRSVRLPSLFAVLKVLALWLAKKARRSLPLILWPAFSKCLHDKSVKIEISTCARCRVYGDESAVLRKQCDSVFCWVFVIQDMRFSPRRVVLAVLAAISALWLLYLCVSFMFNRQKSILRYQIEQELQRCVSVYPPPPPPTSMSHNPLI